MKREDQVASLEPSKKLKELGVKQNSIWDWNHVNNKWKLGLSRDKLFKERGIYDCYSAYTVAELGEMLPNNDNDNGEYVTIKTGGGEWLAWEIQNGLYDSEGHYIIAKTEADARAKMLVYLIKEEIIEKC